MSAEIPELDLGQLEQVNIRLPHLVREAYRYLALSQRLTVPKYIEALLFNHAVEHALEAKAQAELDRDQALRDVEFLDGLIASREA